MSDFNNPTIDEMFFQLANSMSDFNNPTIDEMFFQLESDLALKPESLKCLKQLRHTVHMEQVKNYRPAYYEALAEDLKQLNLVNQIQAEVLRMVLPQTDAETVLKEIHALAAKGQPCCANVPVQLPAVPETQQSVS